MAAAVGHFLTDIGRSTMAPGDVYLTNDPGRARAICTTSRSSRRSSATAC
ncbi:MAG: hypothetical protein R2695_10155 [Acidimicrobiales bacterium]